MKSMRYTILIALAVGASLLAMGLKQPYNCDKSKAEYMFLEAVSRQSHDDAASAFELTARAAELQPNATDFGFQHGLQLMTICRDDSVLFANGYALAERYFECGAKDYYNLFTFGQINDHIGNLDKSLAIWQRLDSLYPTKFAPTLKYAERLSQTRDSANIERAMSLYKKLETLNGKNTAITYRRMSVHMMRGDTSAVINEVHDLIDSAPLNSDYMLMAADLYASFNRPDSALEYYNRAVALDSASGAAIYRRANFFLAQGDTIAYESEVREAMRHESLDFDTKMELMTGFVRDSYSEPSQHAVIEDLFNDMIAANPREVSLRELYSSYLHAVQNYVGSAEQLEYAVDVDPANETRWRNLVGLYIMLEQYDKASDASARALHYFPSSIDFISTIGNAMIVAKNYVGARDYFDKVLADSDSSNVELRGNLLTQLGDISNHLGEREEAVTYYDQAKRLIPHNAMLLNNYAYLLAEMRTRLDEAEEMSAESLLNRPDEPTYLDTYAWVLFQKKDFNGAKTMIDRAIDHSDEPAGDILDHAGDIYFFLGDTDKAFEFWSKAYELLPDSTSLKTKVETHSYPIK